VKIALFLLLLIASKVLDARGSFDKPLGRELEAEWLRINSRDD
jgi:hypothetical protein